MVVRKKIARLVILIAKIAATLMGLFVVAILVFVLVFKWWLHTTRYVSVEDATAFLHEHQVTLDRLTKDFEPFGQLHMVTLGGFDEYHINVAVNESTNVYFVSPLEQDGKPIWLSPLEHVRDFRAALSLKTLLDSANVPDQPFVSVLRLIDSLELYGIDHADGGTGVDIRLKELTGLAFRPDDIGGYSAGGVDSSVHIEGGWYWFLEN